ncbi:hypothetical protein Tco_0499506 [Tanacetum coccineum]
MGPERQPDAAAGAPGSCQDHASRKARLKEVMHEMRGAFTEQHEVIDAMAHDFSRPMYLIKDFESGRGLARPAPPIKPCSKFSTIVHEYDMEPSTMFTLHARMGKRDDFKCMEAKDKSNLKTLLETKVLLGRQPGLLFNFIEYVSQTSIRRIRSIQYGVLIV